MKRVGEYERETDVDFDNPDQATVVEQRMERLGLTQAELARQTDIPKSRISEIVNGRRLPSRRQIEKLSAFFDIPADLLATSPDDTAAAQ